jgi:hypothetical protein
MRRGLVLLLLSAPVAAAQTRPPAPSPPPARPAPARFRWYTQLGDEVLAKVDAVLVGKVASISSLRGTDVVRVTIVRWLQGERPAAEGPLAKEPADVTLLANPGEFFAGTEQLLFLQRYDGGPRYVLHNRVTRSDPDFEAKLASLERTLALKDLPRDEDRRRRVRKTIYDDAAARDAWTRWHAFHELEYVRKSFPDLVTREDREDLARLAARSEDAAFKKALLKLLKEWSP